MSNIQNPNTAFLSQLSAEPNIYFGKFNNTDEPMEQKHCLTVYIDTKSLTVALFDGVTLVGEPEQLILEDENEESVPYAKGILDKDAVTQSFRLPVFRSKSYAFFLQKWTKSAGLLMVENTPFEAVNVSKLMKGLDKTAIPVK